MKFTDAMLITAIMFVVSSIIVGIAIFLLWVGTRLFGEGGAIGVIVILGFLCISLIIYQGGK